MSQSRGTQLDRIDRSRKITKKHRKFTRWGQIPTLQSQDRVKGSYSLNRKDGQALVQEQWRWLEQRPFHDTNHRRSAISTGIIERKTPGRHPDKTRAAIPEKPDFRKWRLRVATREGSTRGRLGGRDCGGAAIAGCPTKAGWQEVGSVEEVSLRTTPSLAREVRPESSRPATTLGHGRWPDRPEEREGTRTGPGRSKDGETHPGRRPADPGLASNTGAVTPHPWHVNLQVLLGPRL